MFRTTGHFVKLMLSGVASWIVLGLLIFGTIELAEACGGMPKFSSVIGCLLAGVFIFKDSAKHNLPMRLLGYCVAGSFVFCAVAIAGVVG